MTDGRETARAAERRSKLLVLILVAAFVFGLAGFAIAVLDARAQPAPTEPPPPSLPVLGAATAAAPPAPVKDEAPRRMLLALAEGEPAVELSPAASEPPVARPSPASVPEAESEPELVETVMPVVPVAGFWSNATSLQRRALIGALETGVARGFKRVVVEDRLAEPLANALDIQLGPAVRRADMAALVRAVRRGALGLVAADSLRPSLRALSVGRASLVGVDRVRRVEDWPLSVPLELPAREAWDQDRVWALVAGGDSFTDRGVYDTVVRKGKGIEYPFAGGTATVTGHGCCDPVYHDNVVPRYQLTGNKGVVRALLRGADLAIANHEQPVTADWAFHSGGFRFSGKPALAGMFKRAGFDFLSLANNHIGDYGASGIADSRRILRRTGSWWVVRARTWTRPARSTSSRPAAPPWPSSPAWPSSRSTGRPTARRGRPPA